MNNFEYLTIKLQLNKNKFLTIGVYYGKQEKNAKAEVEDDFFNMECENRDINWKKMK